MESFDLSKMDKVADLYRLSKHGPFWRYGGITEEQLNRSFIEETSSGVKSGKMAVITADNKDKLLGFIILEKKEWDSEYFGLSMAQIAHFVVADAGARREETGDLLLDKMLQYCKILGIRHLSVKADMGDHFYLGLLERRGFRPLTEEHIHILDKRNFKLYRGADEASFSLRAPREADMSRIISCAARMSEILPGRFLLDNDLPREKTRNYYIECAKRYCRLAYAEEVLIADRQGEAIAFHAHRFFELGGGHKRIKGVYVLMAFVSTEERGKNIGHVFLSSVYRRLLENNDFITGRVLNFNKAMLCILEEKLGAKLLAVQCSLHKGLE